MSRVAVIVGASRGIGLELARQYARDGWRVIAGCREPDDATDLRRLAERADLRLLTVDVASDESVLDFAAAIGRMPVDALVVTAGVPGGDGQTFGSLDFEEMLKTINVNAVGATRIAQAFADILSSASPPGRLVAITSEMGSIERTRSTEMMSYRISKAALNEAWKCVAVEMEKRRVVAMVIHPGWVATDMGGKDAPVTPDASAAGIRNVIEQLRPNDAGTFRTWQGLGLPW